MERIVWREDKFKVIPYDASLKWLMNHQSGQIGAEASELSFIITNRKGCRIWISYVFTSTDVFNIWRVRSEMRVLQLRIPIRNIFEFREI